MAGDVQKLRENLVQIRKALSVYRKKLNDIRGGIRRQEMILEGIRQKITLKKSQNGTETGAITMLHYQFAHIIGQLDSLTREKVHYVELIATLEGKQQRMNQELLAATTQKKPKQSIPACEKPQMNSQTYNNSLNLDSLEKKLDELSSKLDGLKDQQHVLSAQLKEIPLQLKVIGQQIEETTLLQSKFYEQVKQLRLQRDQARANEQHEPKPMQASEHLSPIARFPNSPPDKHDWEDHWIKVDTTKLKKP